jgi:hypothetical protein
MLATPCPLVGATASARQSRLSGAKCEDLRPRTVPGMHWLYGDRDRKIARYDDRAAVSLCRLDGASARSGMVPRASCGDLAEPVPDRDDEPESAGGRDDVLALLGRGLEAEAV